MKKQSDSKLRPIADRLDAMSRELLDDLTRLLHPHGRQATVDRLKRLDRELMEREFERCEGRSLWDRR